MKTKTLYRDILKKAFNITFKNRIFWLLGLFAAPLIGMGEYNIIAGGFGTFSDGGLIAKWYPIVDTGIFRLGTLRYLGKQFLVDPFSVFVLLIVLIIFILLIFFLIWLAVVAQGSLISAIDKAGPRQLTSSKLSPFIATGINRFWPMIGVHFFVKIIISLLMILLSLPMIAVALGGKVAASGALYFIFSLIFIPLAIIIIFISKYAVNYIIIKNENFWSAIKKSYRLFADNWLVTVEMSIVLLFVSIVAGVLLMVLGSFVLFPLVFVVYFLAQIGTVFVVKIIFIFSLLVLVIIGLFFTAILSTFQYSGWVLLFNRLHGGKDKIHGKLARWFDI